MVMFTAVVERPVVEKLLDEKNVQYTKLIDWDTIRGWRISILSQDANTTVSEALIESVHPAIVVTQAVGKSHESGKWEHLISFQFTSHPDV